MRSSEGPGSVMKRQGNDLLKVKTGKGVKNNTKWMGRRFKNDRL